MKTILLKITIFLLTSIFSVAHAEMPEILGVYESNFYNENYAKKSVTQEYKNALDKSYMSITINNEKVIITVGKTDPVSSVLNYVIVKKNFILAFDKDPEMYHPIYIKGNTLYAVGQSFKKMAKSNNPSN